MSYYVYRSFVAVKTLGETWKYMHILRQNPIIFLKGQISTVAVSLNFVRPIKIRKTRVRNFFCQTLLLALMFSVYDFICVT